MVAERYERKSTIVTSNLDIPEWVDAFPNRILGAATIDRLRHGAYTRASWKAWRGCGEGGAEFSACVRVEGYRVDLALTPWSRSGQGLDQLEETVGFLSNGIRFFKDIVEGVQGAGRILSFGYYSFHHSASFKACSLNCSDTREKSTNSTFWGIF